MDTAVSNKVNQSIGEVSFGLCTSLSTGGSQCALDKVNRDDRDGASMGVLAGSICSAKLHEVVIGIESRSNGMLSPKGRLFRPMYYLYALYSQLSNRMYKGGPKA